MRMSSSSTLHASQGGVEFEDDLEDPESMRSSDSEFY